MSASILLVFLYCITHRASYVVATWHISPLTTWYPRGLNGGGDTSQPRGCEPVDTT